MRKTGIHYHKWTPEDDKILICMTQHGASASVIAFLLGVSPEAVKQRRRTLREKIGKNKQLKVSKFVQNVENQKAY